MPVELLQYSDAASGPLDCSQLQVGAGVCLFGTTPTCPMAYQVKAGDTCVSVAQAMGLTSEQFFTLNPGASCGALQAGSVLCVSSAAGENAQHTTNQGPQGCCSKCQLKFMPHRKGTLAQPVHAACA
jgi:Tfp pilus assembly protein FimV